MLIIALEFNLLKSQRTFEMRDIKALRIDLSEIYKLFGDYIEDIDFLLESKSVRIWSEEKLLHPSMHLTVGTIHN